MLVGIFALLAFRLWHLQIVEGARFRQVAEGNRRRTLPVAPLRGNIYDRNGVVLAENVPSFSVQAMVEDLPQDPTERMQMFDQLCHLVQCSGYLEIDPAQLESGDQDRLYRWLADYIEMPRVEAEEYLESMQEPFSQTIKLDETEAIWLREQISGTASVTYTTSLERALQENLGPPYMPVTLMPNIPRDCALILEEQRQTFPGVYVQAESLRRYPTEELTSHIVGYIGRISPQEHTNYNPDPRSGEAQRYLENDLIGKIGVERAFEDILRGQLGIREIQVDATGHPVGAPFQVQEAESGLDIVLTLDTDLQEKVTEILWEYIYEANRQRPDYFKPIYSGVAIAMDPRNGQVLAMVSLPSYDNNAFAKGITTEEFQALIEDPHRPLLNRAVAGEFPPGSTFKLMVAGAGLQSGTITPETRVYDSGALLVPNRYDPSLPPLVFPCWARGGHGWVNVVTAVQHSCNVFFFTVAGGTPENKYEDALGTTNMTHYAHAYGYGEKTGIELPGESAGLIPTPEWKEETLGEVWVQGDLYNMGIGQGNILATPLQVLNTAATTANGGTLYRPQLLLRVLDRQGQVVQDFEPEVIRQLPVKDEYLALVRQGMRQSVSQGYNSYARTHASVAIAGKTGSAEFGPYLYKKNRQAHAWFVAFAPYEDPQLAVVVMVEGGGEGSRVAVPAATDIIEYYFTRPQEPAEEGGYGAADSD
jgi:penicillin-binding protein 2